MKKTYTAPCVEFEYFELDESIASNCGIVVTNGPAMGSHPLCADYAELMGGKPTTFSVHNVLFYEDTNCDCYTTGSNFGFWTS